MDPVRTQKTLVEYLTAENYTGFPSPFINKKGKWVLTWMDPVRTKKTRSGDRNSSLVLPGHSDKSSIAEEQLGLVA